MRPYRRAAGVTAGKTSTAGTVRRAGGRECTTSKLRRMRPGTRGHCRASRRTHQKGGNLDGHLGPGSVRPSPLPRFRQRKRSQRTLKRRCFRPAGSPVAGPPAARRPRKHQTPFGSQSRPSETRKRRSSDRSPRSTLAICSGGLDPVPLLTEWQLSTNSPASCLSTANGIGRDWIPRPSAERMNSSTDHRLREIDLGLSGPALNGVMHVRYGRTAES